MWDNPFEDDAIEWDATEIEWDAIDFQPPTPEHRKKLRRDTLRYARLFPPGAERNQLRSIARSLTFFEAGPTSNPVREKGTPAPPRVANVALLRRW
jgi:hypothetical protein